jgi:hypothetical protein
MKNKYTCCVKGCKRQGCRSYSSLRDKDEYEYKKIKDYICEGHYRRDLRKYHKDKEYEKFKLFCNIILKYENYK